LLLTKSSKSIRKTLFSLPFFCTVTNRIERKCMWILVVIQSPFCYKAWNFLGVFWCYFKCACTLHTMFHSRTNCFLFLFCRPAYIHAIQWLAKWKSGSLVLKKNSLSFGQGPPWWFNKVDFSRDIFYCSPLVLISALKKWGLVSFLKDLFQKMQTSVSCFHLFYSIDVKCLKHLVSFLDKFSLLPFVISWRPFSFHQSPFIFSPRSFFIQLGLFTLNGAL